MAQAKKPEVTVPVSMEVKRYTLCALPSTTHIFVQLSALPTRINPSMLFIQPLLAHVCRLCASLSSSIKDDAMLVAKMCFSGSIYTMENGTCSQIGLFLAKSLLLII